MHPIVQRLAALVVEHGWHAAFDAALADVAAQRVPQLAHLRSLGDYLGHIDDMVRWAPREAGDSRLVHDKLVEFHFVLDQPSLRALQSPIEPGANARPLTPLSTWIVDYAKAWGTYLDEPASAEHIDSFRTNPAFCWDDYMPPPSGYRTFNQFFGRHVKPGRRPVTALLDPALVVSPADASFMGAWPIGADSTIESKGLRWSIEELLRDSNYAHRFAGGVFTHLALRTFDYHRWHSPVAGRVLEARIIEGQAFLDVEVVESHGDLGQIDRRLQAVEGTAYQFVQMRGLVVLESAIGLVACLPVGMAQVSSVVITAEVGATLRKGEEMGYFQFGGSDSVLVFEPSSAVTVAHEMERHFLQGAAFAQAEIPSAMPVDPSPGRHAESGPELGAVISNHDGP